VALASLAVPPPIFLIILHILLVVAITTYGILLAKITVAAVGCPRIGWSLLLQLPFTSIIAFCVVTFFTFLPWHGNFVTYRYLGWLNFLATLLEKCRLGILPLNHITARHGQLFGLIVMPQKF